MKSATKATISAFGIIAGLAAIEHGVGEILQGNTRPAAMVFESWPGSAFFRIVAGEPAMSLVPNLLVTGILAICAALIFLVWATRFVQRKHGGLVLILLAMLMLLVGGGFGPPLLGSILSLAASQIHAPPNRWRTLRFLDRLWPLALAGGLVSWLAVVPGSMLLDYYLGVSSPTLEAAFILSAFGFLLLTILAAFGRDSQREICAHEAASMIPGRSVSQAIS